MQPEAPLVGIVMGSQSDWETLRHAAATLAALDIAHERRKMGHVTVIGRDADDALERARRARAALRWED